MKLAAFLFILIVADILNSSEAWLWRGRRGRRRTPRCTTPTTSRVAYANRFDQAFTFTCRRGRALNFVQSLYSSCHRDRVFKFSCKYNKATRGECSWSGWVNHFDKLVHYKCPDNGFLTGIGSYHHDHYEDRRFRFRCCHNKRYIRHSCVTTGYINNWRAAIYFRTPSRYYLVGATSVHDNGQEDRRWRFEYCKVYSKRQWYKMRNKGKKN